MSSDNQSTTTTTNTIRCHYDVLGVAHDADAATIKKSHRKLALQYHPDKNHGNDSAADEFRRVQQAYECLSDPQERQWYDDHRLAILAGWSGQGGGGDDDPDSSDIGKAFLFHVVPYTFAGCYRGFGDDEGGFYATYRNVFGQIVKGEQLGATRTSSNNDNDKTANSPLLDDLIETDFGNSTSPWSDVAAFYRAWESFTTSLNFAWEDLYDARPNDGNPEVNRRVRRAMGDENKKARRAAKRARNDEVLALVRFVKKRDPRVQEQLEQQQLAKVRASQQLASQKAERKRAAQQAKQDWKVQAELDMAQQEEEDRKLGRIRLADMDDDYDYGGGKKKKKGKRKNKGKNKNSQQLYPEVEEVEDKENDGSTDADEEQSTAQDGKSAEVGELKPELENEVRENDHDENDNHLANDDDKNEIAQALLDDEEEYLSSSSEEEDEEPDVWRCEVCRKDFKSNAQLENHMKSKKHKENYKKHLKKLEKEQQVMDEFLVS
mmetsp:Transcript_24178/g.67032  ORF Transcript_24178/g.67032 Transcript_24178/m.67032 type:complete len:492 (-) Transcript_24178:355-1830(-)